MPAPPPPQRKRKRKRRRDRRPSHDERQILDWADDHFRRTGDWPRKTSGIVRAVLGETWNAVHLALYWGRRGLPGGTSLAQLLAEKRGYRNHLALPPFTEEKILAW